MKKNRDFRLIGLGALGILFGRKMPGVKVIADAERVARCSAQPVGLQRQRVPFRLCHAGAGPAG